MSSLPVIFDKLPYALYTSTKLVTPWTWPKCMAEACRSCVLLIQKHCVNSWWWNLCTLRCCTDDTQFKNLVGLTLSLRERLQEYLNSKFWRTSLSSSSKKRFKFLHQTGVPPHPNIVAHCTVSERFSVSRWASPNFCPLRSTDLHTTPSFRATLRSAICERSGQAANLDLLNWLLHLLKK